MLVEGLLPFVDVKSVEKKVLQDFLRFTVVTILQNIPFTYLISSIFTTMSRVASLKA
jgi:hypothetical protein